MRFIIDMVLSVGSLIYVFLPATFGFAVIVVDNENAEKRRSNIWILVFAVYALMGIVLFNYGLLRLSFFSN